MIKQFYTYKEVVELVDQFENILRKHTLEIKQGSVLEEFCLNVVDIYDKYLNPNKRDPKIDYRSNYREFIGIQDLMIKIVRVAEHPYFDRLEPHLALLNNSIPTLNDKTPSIDQDNNKIFELYVACLCLALDPEEIRVDNPQTPKGDNPDVIAMFGGKKWGFACKAAHSKEPKSIFDNISKAVEQIEKSNVDVGIPIINLKNIIDHEKFWPLLNKREHDEGSDPEFKPFASNIYPFYLLDDFANNVDCNIKKDTDKEEMEILFRNKKSLPAYLLYCPTASYIISNGKKYPTRINSLKIMSYRDISEDDLYLLNGLNHQLQLSYYNHDSDNMNYGTFINEKVSYILVSDGKVIIIENVPAVICLETGQKLFLPETLRKIQETAWSDKEPNRIIETAVFDYEA